MSLLTWRKTVSTVVDAETIVQYEYDDLGESLEGDTLPTLAGDQAVKVDCDQNRYVYADNVDNDGFDVKGGPVGDDAPYNLTIAIETNT